MKFLMWIPGAGKWFATWLQRLWDGHDHSVEVKLLAFASGVVASIIWLSLALVHNDYKITAEWNTAFEAFLILVGAGVGIQVYQGWLQRRSQTSTPAPSISTPPSPTKYPVTATPATPDEEDKTS